MESTFSQRNNSMVIGREDFKDSNPIHLAANEVHIWMQPLPHKGGDFLSKLNSYTQVLSQEERERVHRKQKLSVHDALRLAMSRTFLREVLAMYIGQRSLDIHIEYMASGKPYVEHGPQFNLSHTEGCCILALAAHTELGIDVEQVRPLLRMNAVIQRFLTEEEKCYVLDHGKEELVTLRRVWQVITQKEAWIKARGQSLCGQWRKLNTMGDRVDQDHLMVHEEIDYVLHSLKIDPSYTATLCTTGRTIPLVHWMNVK